MIKLFLLIQIFIFIVIYCISTIIIGKSEYEFSLLLATIIVLVLDIYMLILSIHINTIIKKLWFIITGLSFWYIIILLLWKTFIPIENKFMDFNNEITFFPTTIIVISISYELFKSFFKIE